MEKSWFEERIGKTVIRSYDGRDTEFEITVKNAGYLYLFTLKGFTYREATIAENATDDSWLDAAKPVVRIHRTLQSCQSCEG